MDCFQIWLSAARLEESRGQSEMVDKIVDRALTSLKANMVEINRDLWLHDAIDAEKAGCRLTSQAIMYVFSSFLVERRVYVLMLASFSATMFWESASKQRTGSTHGFKMLNR